MSHTHYSKYLASLLAALFSASLIQAQTSGDWIVNADGNWSDAANWSSDPNVPDGAGSTVNIDAAITANRTVTLDTTDRTVGTLNIGSTDFRRYSITSSGGATLIMDNDGDDAAINFLSTGNVNTITAPLILNSNLVLNNQTSSTQSIVMSSLSSGAAGTQIITNSGTGNGVMQLTMPTGTNTYTDLGLVQNSATSRLHFAGSAGGTYTFTEGVEINNAILSVFWGAHLGSSNLTLHNASYWRLGVSGASTASGDVSMGGSFTLNDPDGTGTQGPLTMSGPVTLTSNTDIFVYGSNGNLTLSNVVSGDYSMTKSGDRTLTLTGANTFSGGFIQTEGTTNASNNLTVLGTGDLTLQGGRLRIGNSTFNTNFGYDTTVTGDVILTSWRPAGAGSGVTHTLGTLEIGSHTLTVDLTNQASGTAGFTFGATDVTGDATFNLISDGATARVNLGALNGTGSLTVDGDGILHLTTAAGTYSGTTTVLGGTLELSNSAALGGNALQVNGGTVSAPSGASLSNSDILLAGGNYTKNFANAETFANYLAATSNFVDGIATTASFVDGAAGAVRVVSTAFATAPADPVSNDGIRASEVFNLSGTDTDIFTLQLAIDSVSTSHFLGWVENGVWVNAVDGNSSTGSSAVQGFLGSYAAAEVSASAAFLGSWGVDTDSGSVWAILDHNSEFAVIPEPSTAALFLALCAFIGASLARRRTS